MPQEATVTNRQAFIRRLALISLVLLMFLWGVGGLILLGGRYAEDIGGAEREADEILDYFVFYSAGRLVLEGRGNKLYDLNTIGEKETETFGTTIEGENVYPYLNPPFVAAILAPFTLLPPVTFALLFTTFNAVLLVVAGRAVQRKLRLDFGYQRWLFWLAYLTGFSVVTIFWHQQFTPLVLVAWLAFVSFQMSGKEGLSGACLALALVKPHFALLPVAFLLFHRRWQALRSFAAVASALVLVSIAVSGPSVLIDYPLYLLTSTQWEENGIFGQYMLGWQGLLADATGDTTPSRGPLLMLSIPTVAVVVWSWRGTWNEHLARLPLVMAVALFATLLITPHLYLHDILLGSLALSLAGMESVRRTGSLGPWGALGLALWVVQMPRSFFYYTELPLVTVFTLGVFLFLVWHLKRGGPSTSEVEISAEQLAA